MQTEYNTNTQNEVYVYTSQTCAKIFSIQLNLNIIQNGCGFLSK